ncbi:MAG: YraN family protein [Sulfurimicrobium sp.]|nr:YraN family protein [Sulfurimicrobium sp.]MDO9189634.1 YraN family protein [Sulfurimicrobium sp.]MDP1705272.1 YraN family protein [Sulfurimicrobium sp.]MDP2199635.1 YraN family protein [Sulfurimicrobium sp.]MDP2961164.1 YraN family protein [Sulfurimicrobium sp.]
MDAGKEAENQAASFLQSQGLRLVARNYRCRMGEVDLIMEHGDTLVFVEVRLRHSASFGGAAASITGHKQRKLIHAAQHYLQQQVKQPPCRFDALLLDGLKIEWIKDAFSA